ncbi:serum response factor-binding protein 1-like [Myxocyprinus asiaticus]|uniref:serum response factor-binding protein 1-like n=1 Tax=Myxocyprinus asiaticus TaxID=70543 RepID=UPI0022230C07|nr:serum response factor-binding protein 1-like [Myxocyprinus asiaticus]XP_051520102.1 serum response factor-binding protein 1-like [Myxocyprinus asiaticus]
MPTMLNLSNEVVKMRAEVKRVKVLLIRKLIRQVSVLEKKKGNEADLERHRRRAARLREEIHELKVIAPDNITKAALQKDISFEKVCQNKEASLSERAIARIATHPQFSKKIQSIKEAIKAFKEERINARKAEKLAKNNAEDVTPQHQAQEGSDDDDNDVGSEKSDDDDGEEKLTEEESEKNTDKQQDEADGSSTVSQKTCLETLNEETNQCQKEQMSTTENSAETVSVPKEVVRMRKEVKRTRVLIISKLTQQVAALKKKKSPESEVKESQEMVAGILKEIQVLRSIKPDQVTMTALQENTELEKVMQNPQANPMDRAIARIVTHSRFVNKLQKVKEAIEEERAKAAEAEQKKEDKQILVQSNNEDEEEEENNNEEEEDDDGNEDEEEEEEEEEVGEDKLNNPSIEIHKSGIEEPTDANSQTVKLSPSKVITTPSEKPRDPKVKPQSAYLTSTIVKSSPEKSSKVTSIESKLPKSIVKSDKEKETIIKSQKKQDLPETKKPETEKDEEESDLSDDEEEKEYFDDSTEERFRRQSSQSEESEDDDFFLGKVSKFKKKKSCQGKVKEKKGEPQKLDKLQNTEAATGKPHKRNLGKLQSVFCSTLSKSSISSQNAKYGFRHDDPRPPRFQNQRKGPEGKMKASRNKGPDPGVDRRTGHFKPITQTFKYAGERHGGPSGAGSGKSQFEHHHKENPRGPSGKISNPPQQALHPSWEASRKRKEQQAQITVFQGKKIKFDDDD